MTHNAIKPTYGQFEGWHVGEQRVDLVAQNHSLVDDTDRMHQ
ncbi:MAG: hypothetical protein SFY66_12640 [Oculatellaceae cyanobacterium bins.114]|nr:hypothetical protein [Oculatellaceae cyanobacterium bins.114]